MPEKLDPFSYLWGPELNPVDKKIELITKNKIDPFRDKTDFISPRPRLVEVIEEKVTDGMGYGGIEDGGSVKE